MKKITALLGIIFTSACTHPSIPLSSGTGICSIDTIQTVSFSRDVQPILAKNCSQSGCHSGSNPAAHIALDSSSSYAQLTKPGTGLVDIVNPTSSLLYVSLNSDAKPMPPYGKLNDCTIRVILKWIQQKALNN